MRPRPAGQSGRRAGRAGGAPASGVSLCAWSGWGGGGRRSCGRPGAGTGPPQLRGRAGCGLAGSAPRPPSPPPACPPAPRPVQLRRGAGSRPVQLRRRLPGAEGGGLGEGAWEPPQLQRRPGRPRLRGPVQLQWRPGGGRRGRGPSRAGAVAGRPRGLARRGVGEAVAATFLPRASSYDFSFVVAVTRVCFLVCCLRCFPAAPALRPPPPSLWFNLPLSPCVFCTVNYMEICISPPLRSSPLRTLAPHSLGKKIQKTKTKNPTLQTLSGPRGSKTVKGLICGVGVAGPLRCLGLIKLSLAPHPTG